MLDTLAAAVSDGTPVDWTAAAADASAGRIVTQLQVVAAVAELHRGAQSSAEAAPAPQTWGHLRILERIGRGAFGNVYRAFDPRLDREVALKLIPATLPQSDASLSTFIGEGRLLAKVRHPNVVTIHGADQIDGHIGLWMELVRGRTLEERLRSDGTLTPEEVIRVGIQLLQAVVAVHTAGLLHRDIKTQNVMQADDGGIVLMDFGTGRELVDPRTDLAGTPLFLAPEIFAGQPASAQSDIYSIGVLLYHLLTSAYPVEGRTVSEIRRAHEQKDSIGRNSELPDRDAPLARIIERAIQPAPDKRQQSAAEMLADFERLAQTRRPKWLGWAIAGAAGLALALAIYGVTTNGGSDHAPGSILSAGQSPAIAVIPFANLSSEADSGLLVDGLTSEVIRRLAAIEGLAIRSSAASFAWRGDATNLRDVGRDLNANLVLRGSVLAASGQVRVSAELVRVSDLTTVWNDSFRFSGRDVLTAHDEISLAIVNRLMLRVGQGRRRYQLDPDLAYLFLKAQGLMARRHVANAARAAELFEQIVSRDPSFAPAWAGLASALGASFRATTTEEAPPPNPRMERAALEAIRLDPRLAESHAALGNLHALDREWKNAEAAFLSALELNPSLTTTYTDYVLSILQPMGRHSDSLRLLNSAIEIDPLSLDVRRILAMTQVDAGHYDDAMASARWVLERDALFPYAEVWLGRALMLTGRTAEAEPIFAREPGRFGFLGYLFAVTGRRDEALALAAAHPESPSRQMLIYAGLGDKERAMAALEKAVALNWWRAAAWMHRPEMALLRGDPRLEALKNRLGLPH